MKVERYLRNNWLNKVTGKLVYGIDAEMENGEIVHVKNGDKAFWDKLQDRNKTIYMWNMELYQKQVKPK